MAALILKIVTRTNPSNAVRVQTLSFGMPSERRFVAQGPPGSSNDDCP